MAFTHGYEITLLFSWWNTNTQPQYAGSLLVIYCACLAQAWLQRRRDDRLACNTQTADQEQIPLFGSGGSSDPAGFCGAVCRRQVADGAEEALSIALGFAVMLSLMTFNSGVFCTTVLGVLSGRRIFHQRRDGPRESTKHNDDMCGVE